MSRSPAAVVTLRLQTLNGILFDDLDEVVAEACKRFSACLWQSDWSIFGGDGPEIQEAEILIYELQELGAITDAVAQAIVQRKLASTDFCDFFCRVQSGDHTIVTKKAIYPDLGNSWCKLCEE